MHRQYTCPPGDVLIVYARLGGFFIMGVRRYQTWYAQQTQHVKWAYFRLKLWQRRALARAFELESVGLNWLFFVLACILVVMLAFVAV
jgi:hypothetical protein